MANAPWVIQRMPSAHGNHKMIELVEMKNDLMAIGNLEANSFMKAERVGAYDDPKVWSEFLRA